MQPAADGRVAGRGWSHAARWLAIASAALVVAAALLAGSAIGSMRAAQTCVDPPGQAWFGCAWGHRLGAFMSATAGGVLAVAAAAALLLSGVSRDAARRDPARRTRTLAIGWAAAGLALLIVAFQMDALGPCLQCPLWHHPSPLLGAVTLAWAPLAAIAAATASTAAVAGRRAGPLGGVPETVK